MARWLIVALLVFGSAAAAKQTQDCNGEVCVVADQSHRGIRLSVRNLHDVATVTVFVEIAVRSQRPVRREETTVVVLPGQMVQVIDLTVGGSGGWRYDYTYRYSLGDYRARPKEVAYALPWVTGAFRVLQGCNGFYSHKGPMGQALDFDMPTGTPIAAARAGRVVKTRATSRRGGASRRYQNDDNYVIIEHDDGSLATYAHLQTNQVAVRPGQRVRAGDVLGRSGNTGWSTQPHLHFEVFTPLADGNRRSWPIRLKQAGTCPAPGTVLTVGR